MYFIEMSMEIKNVKISPSVLDIDVVKTLVQESKISNQKGFHPHCVKLQAPCLTVESRAYAMKR